MSLFVGTRIGPYEITGTLGAGGMGEVYRATDINLTRQVAIKVLPDTFANDPERLARFEREAKTLAALNHPNIAQIYGLEKSSGIRALVMELVEGPTLADRIAQGPIPVDEALPIAKQIAEALEAAHEQSIIHRDLKPANIKLRPDGRVKVLDFGLAKALEPTGSSDQAANLTDSPTITSPALMTGVGVLLGTAAYMSPEQARGKPADKRSDLWAFGCVLYEMLTGTRAFEGNDVAETLAAVIKGIPDLDQLSSNTPIAIRHLIRRCLAKDRQRRLGDAAAARLEIEDTLNEPAPATAPGPRYKHAAAIAGIGLAAFITGVLLGLSRSNIGTSSDVLALPSRLFLELPPGFEAVPSTTAFVISPDGRRIAYAATRSGVGQLLIRSLDHLDALPLPGIQGAIGSLFFSPDGEWIGYRDSREGKLKKVRVSGGPSAILCDAPRVDSAFFGATWGPNGSIVFAVSNVSPGLMQVSAEGGEPRPLTMPREGETHIRPSFLPNGRALLFVVARRGSPERVAVLSLETGEVRTLLPGTSPRYAASGHIVFGRERTLWAVPFDPERLQTSGTPAPVIDQTDLDFFGSNPRFDISVTGTLIYGSNARGQPLRTLTWVDRQGKEEPIGAPARAYVYPRLSPDATRIALEVRDEEDDVWIWNVNQKQLSRLTYGPAADRAPVWSADGSRVIFSSDREGVPNLFWQPADSVEAPEQLTDSVNPQYPTAITPDGKSLTFREMSGASEDVMQLALDGSGRVVPLVQTSASERNGAISPDGRWVAYESNQLGSAQVFVRPAEGGGQRQVTVSGGTRPLWSRNGRELFYVASRKLMSVTVEPGSSWAARTPVTIVTGPYFLEGVAVAHPTYDVSPDGSRFVMIKETGDPRDEAGARLVVVQNWTEELKRLVPPN